MTANLLNNMLWDEDIVRQRAPLDNKIFAKLHQTATARKFEDSVSDLLFNVVALGRYIGPCLSEYAQTTQGKVNYHTIILVLQSSKLSLPTTSSSTTIGSASSRN
jgi:hypothetical protein